LAVVGISSKSDGYRLTYEGVLVLRIFFKIKIVPAKPELQFHTFRRTLEASQKQAEGKLKAN
jgi:hypothetical protein